MTRKRTHTITLVDDKKYDLVSPVLSKQVALAAQQEKITLDIPNQIEALNKQLFEYDAEGNPTKRKEGVDVPKIREEKQKLSDEQIQLSAEICIVAFKNYPEVTTQYFMDNADMTDYLEVLTFVLGGKPAVAELFRKLGDA